MGWLCMEKPYFVKEYFEDNFTYENEDFKSRPLEVSIKHFKTLYAAIERTNKKTGEVEVFAAVYLLKFYRGKKDRFGYVIKEGEMCYKDMTEFCGPFERNCPAKILKLLTPLKMDTEEDRKSNKTAQEWREDCWKNIEEAKSLNKVKFFKSERPLNFTDGSQHQYFEKVITKNYFGKGRRGKVRFSNPNARDLILSGRVKRNLIPISKEEFESQFSNQVA